MKRILMIVIFAAMLCMSTLLLQVTLAKYRDKVSSPLNTTVANWNIKLNNEEIRNKTQLETDITPVFDTNPNVKENVIAPGSTGYFDITIDATNVDVNFTFKVDITNDNENIQDIKAIAYSINGGERQEYTNSSIEGEITHNTPSTTVRIFIIWDDSEQETMDNQADTELALNTDSLSLNANIEFTQKK